VNKIKKKTKNKPKNEKVTNQTKQRKKGMEAETKKMICTPKICRDLNRVGLKSQVCYKKNKQTA
jgi:hypothetical protein